MHDAATTRAALQVGAAVRVHPARVQASPWTGEVVELEARGVAESLNHRADLGVLVLPTMPGPGWSKLPVWLPYCCVQPMVEA